MNQIISRDPLGRTGALLLWSALAVFAVITIPRSAWPNPVRSERPALDMTGWILKARPDIATPPYSDAPFTNRATLVRAR